MSLSLPGSGGGCAGLELAGWGQGEGRIGKRILRELLAKYLPAQILDRPKAGFSLPLGQWLRGPLRPWAEDLLGPDCLRRQGLLDGELIQQRWKQHLSGQRNWSAALWWVLMFQAWTDEWQVRM